MKFKTLLFLSALLPGTQLAAASLDIPSGTYKLDKEHGYIAFTYSHQGYSNPWLHFRDFDVTLNLDVDDLAMSSAEVSINAASIDSGVDRFDVVLRDESFFYVEIHPRATFRTTSVDVADEDAMTLTGDLTIKGITRPVTLATRLNKTGQTSSKKYIVGFSARTMVNRSDFDLGSYVPLVGDEVSIMVEVELQKAD